MDCQTYLTEVQRCTAEGERLFWLESQIFSNQCICNSMHMMNNLDVFRLGLYSNQTSAQMINEIMDLGSHGKLRQL